MALHLAQWCILSLAFVAIGAVATPASPRTIRTFYAACATISLVMLALAAGHLLTHAPAETTRLPIGLPWIGVRLRIDAISAFFQIIVNFGGFAASLYAIGYGVDEETPKRVLPFYAIFLAGMNLVLIADDAFTFLASWEFMSLSSWALVVSRHRDRRNVEAGYVYLLMAAFGTFALLLVFGLLAGADGHYGFAEIRGASRAAGLAGAALVLALVATGSKAGLAPLHVWLPLAHPAAPSHVSALMSGVMTKVAIYGFVRIVFDLLGPPDWWWGLIVLTTGGATAAMGVLYAVFERDLKRLLAYSTVENIGVVFVGLGLALAFKTNGMGSAAALAFTAAVFHALNHSLFKSLLFFGAGAVLHGTGERDIEKLGGLIHRMPQTAFVFLGGCLAISALPPLNGFASEWLLFQGILLSPDIPQWGLKLAIPAIGALLALAAALAGACFVRAYGIVFLGRPRSERASAAHEVDLFSRSAMFLLLAGCVLTGILPGLVIDATAPVTMAAVGESMPRQISQPWLNIVPIAASRSSYNGLLVMAFIAFTTVAAVRTIHRFASDRLRRAPAWDCGFPNADSASQYTAASFAQPIGRVFGETMFRTREEVDMPAPGELRPARLTLSMRDLIWDAVYGRIQGLVDYLSRRLNILQFLTIRLYLSLVFAVLVILLLAVSIWT